MSSHMDSPSSEEADVVTEADALTAAGLCSCGCGAPLSRDSDAYKAEIARLAEGIA